MKKPGNILIVDDNRGVLTAVQLLLKPHFEKIITLTSPVTLTSVLREETPSVVLLDMNFTSGINTGNEGLFWLQEIKRLRPSLPVVLFTAYGDIDLAVRGIKEGATDFIVKPWDNQKLVETLLNAAQAIHNKNNGKSASPVTPAMYWGESPIMQQLRSLVEKVAITNANILITGENGTGKEMLAREIHALSSRRTKEMIAVDMGAITETLFESELFGHVKGAFTDARTDRAGKFDVQRATEQKIPKEYWKHLQKGETVELDGRILTPEMVLGPPRRGIKLTYCTDTRPTDSIRKNAKGSDLFICEGMYGEKEKAAKAVEYKHMTFYEAANLAKEAEVGEMWLTHYSPSLRHPEEYMDEVRAIFPHAIAGKDRMTTELDFPE